MRLKLLVFAFITLMIALLAQFSSGADYWVYIRKATKITDYDNAEQVAGRSDTGDIVEVLPCTSQYVPTKRELEIYKIIKVKDFENLDRVQLKDTIRDTEEIPIKYRRYNIDISALGVKEVFQKNEIESKVTDKISNKPISFYTDRIR